jgi:23S rRNA (uracil1939-C5)-methyltransferase
VRAYRTGAAAGRRGRARDGGIGCEGLPAGRPLCARSIGPVPSRRPKPRPDARPADLPPADATLHCRHFGVCGGCSLLDQPIAWQIHDKVAACEKLLAPWLGGTRIAMAVPTGAPRHFRTRLLYPVRGDRDGRPIVGIYAFRSHELVRIEECRTQDLWLTAFGRTIETVLRDLRLRPYYQDSGRGVVKAIQARLASGTGQVVASIVTRPGPFAEGREFAQRVMAAAKTVTAGHKRRELVGVVHSISERDDEFLLGDRHVPLAGTPHVEDRRDGLTFRIGAGSFYQIHADAHELLYDAVLQLAGPVRGLTVVDGYGGIGAFGLRFAKAGAKSVLVVEESADACRDATHNAKANDLPAIAVQHAAFAGAKLPATPDLMVVDPPRTGLRPAGVAKVLQSRPRRLLHIACAAEALASDLKGLVAGGYRVTAMRLCDLFPHTEHVELVALLERAAAT